VLPARVTVGFRLRPIAPEIMPLIGGQLLADVYDSAALRVAARGRPAQHRQRIPGALVEVSAWIPGRAVALCPGAAVGAE
jgi:hypothetical protein